MNLIKKTITYTCCCLLIGGVFAQEAATSHAIQQGETLSGLAKKYGTTVGNIMRANGMNSKSVLKIGQSIKIPGKQSIVDVPETKPATAPPPIAAKPVATKPTPAVVAATVPINGKTYTVLPKEGLYSIAKKNNITVAQLKQWNNLTSDAIKTGQVLTLYQAEAVAIPIPVNKPISSAPTNTPVVSTQQVIAEPPAKSVPAPTTNTKVETKSSTMPAVAQPGNNTAEPAPILGNRKYVELEGFFATYFDRANKNNNTTTGDAATFKSVSGWSDKKYYILTNNIEVGTIVRITTNSKSICAKVLNALPEMKEDAGLIARINNAAASALGLDQNKFPITINW